MIKKVILHLLLVLLCNTAFCQQENEFVEVLVQDTVKFDADEIIFNLYIRKNIYAETVVGKASDYKNRIRETTQVYEMIKGIIQTQKIDTLPPIDYAISEDIYGGMISRMMVLRFKSATQLSHFIKSVSSRNILSGDVVSKKSTRADTYKEVLIKKLLDKAFSDAKNIAEQNRKTLGKIIQVKEENIETGADSGGWTSYPPLSALSSNIAVTAFSPDRVQVTIERKLRVRYSWQ
jgi:hypothetical protein